VWGGRRSGTGRLRCDVMGAAYVNRAAELVERALAGADPSLVEPIVPPPETPFVAKAWRGTASRRSTRTSRKLRFG
jgi:hypothetical protein